MTRWWLTTIAIILVVIASIPQQGHGTSSSSSIVANVTSDGIHVSVNLSMFQNLTSFQSNMALPQFQGTIVGSNATSLESSLQSAIRSLIPSASVDSVSLQEASSAWSNSTNIQYLNVSLAYNVVGVETSTNGVYHVDMSWMPWATSSSVPLGAFEGNRIGDYLVAGAKSLSLLPPTQVLENGNIVIRLVFDVNTNVVLGSSLPTVIQDLAILNFTQISSPLSAWTKSFDSGSNSVNWSLNTRRVRLVDIFQTTNEAGNSTRLDYSLSYGLLAKVSAPGGSSAQGNMVITTFQGVPEQLMGVIIISTVIILAGTTLYERRIQGKGPRKRRKG